MWLVLKTDTLNMVRDTLCWRRRARGKGGKVLASKSQLALSLKKLALSMRKFRIKWMPRRGQCGKKFLPKNKKNRPKPKFARERKNGTQYQCIVTSTTLSNFRIGRHCVISCGVSINCKLFLSTKTSLLTYTGVSLYGLTIVHTTSFKVIPFKER